MLPIPIIGIIIGYVGNDIITPAMKGVEQELSYGLAPGLPFSAIRDSQTRSWNAVITDSIASIFGYIKHKPAAINYWNLIRSHAVQDREMFNFIIDRHNDGAAALTRVHLLDAMAEMNEDEKCELIGRYIQRRFISSFAGEKSQSDVVWC